MSYTITLPGKPQLYHNGPTPQGWSLVGEIQRNDGTGTGALIRNNTTGLYAQLNAGSIRTLDRRAVDTILGTVLQNMTPDEEILLTATQAAELAGLTVQGIRYWQEAGHIRPVEGTKPPMYRKKDVLAAKEREIKVGRPKKVEDI